jgi:hypothetical protein
MVRVFLPLLIVFPHNVMQYCEIGAPILPIIYGHFTLRKMAIHKINAETNATQ